MIPLPANVRVWLATGHTDMRKGFSSLGLIVQETLKRDPHGGHLFVFRSWPRARPARAGSGRWCVTTVPSAVPSRRLSPTSTPPTAPARMPRLGWAISTASCRRMPSPGSVGCTNPAVNQARCARRPAGRMPDASSSSWPSSGRLRSRSRRWRGSMRSSPQSAPPTVLPPMNAARTVAPARPPSSPSWKRGCGRTAPSCPPRLRWRKRSTTCSSAGAPSSFSSTTDVPACRTTPPNGRSGRSR